MARTYGLFVFDENKTGVPNQFQAHWDPQLQLIVACFPSSMDLDPNMIGPPYDSWLIDHQGMSPFFLGPSPEEQVMTTGFELHDKMIVCMSWSPVKGVVCCKACNSVKLAIPIANSSPPYDTRAIPWDSAVLPLGTPRGMCTRGAQWIPVSWFGLRGHSLGAVPQPRLLSPSGLHCRHFWEKCWRVSVLLPQHETALILMVISWRESLASLVEAASARS